MFLKTSSWSDRGYVFERICCTHLTFVELPASYLCLGAIAVDKRRMGRLGGQLTRLIKHPANAHRLREQSALRSACS